jgi:hypothetical protein
MALAADGRGADFSANDVKYDLSVLVCPRPIDKAANRIAYNADSTLIHRVDRDIPKIHFSADQAINPLSSEGHLSGRSDRGQHSRRSLPSQFDAFIYSAR